MKRLLCIVLTAIMLLGSIPAIARESTLLYGNKTILQGTPVIDGKIDDIYRESFYVNISGPTSYGVDSEGEASVYTLYDSNYVYIVAEVIDTTPFEVDTKYLEEDSHPHLNDALEIRIKADGHMAPYNGSIADHHLFYADWKGRRFSSYEQQVVGFKGATTNDYGKSFIVEIAIPLLTPLEIGETISFNIQVDNMTLQGEETEEYAFSCISLAEGKNLINFKVGEKVSGLGNVGAITDPTEKEPESEATMFKDVRSNDWFCEDVLNAYNSGIIKGTSADEFSPNDDVTRAMFAKILHRLDGEPVVNYDMPFTDFSRGEWYADAVKWAASNGIISGINNTTFAPDEKITREQIATMIFRYICYKGKGPQGAWASTLPYKDATSISAWARASAMYCYNESIMTGDKDRLFHPQDFATRAEVATVVNRLAKVLEK
ncbi:MAG: S-layer homology domain-containing protein [Clostridia bacterium]|nr:S-layer homology domain-containing protein [Clostridia bacterium]